MLITTDGVRGLRRSFGIKKYKLNKKRSSINFEERFFNMNYFFRLDEDMNTSLSKNKRESNIAAT